MTFTPLCPNCNKRMYIGKSMSGYHWYCEDYAYDGGIIMKVEKINESGVAGQHLSKINEGEEIKDEGKN